MKRVQPSRIRSPKSLRAVIQGYPFSIEVHRLETDTLWTLEVIDHTGTSHVWREGFASDKEARDTAINALEAEGPAAFVSPSNVTPLRQG